MKFDDLLEDYCHRFRNESFLLRAGERIASKAREANVPEEPGAYLIYAVKQQARYILYIGKAGTLRNNGTFKDQKIRGRLSARQKDQRRQEFFQEKIEELELDGLMFCWFVTFQGDTRILPAKAEADLLQESFNENGKLPAWNESM